MKAVSYLLTALKNTFRYYLTGLYHRSDEHHIFLLGGGVAFSLFFCILPFILIIISLLGHVLEVSAVKTQIFTMVEQMIPYSRYAEFAKKIINTRIQEVAAHKNRAGYLGLVGLLFTASGLFRSLRTVLNLVFKIDDRTSLVKSRLKEFAMVFVVTLLALTLTILLPVLELAKEFLDKLRFQPINDLLFSLSSLVVTFGIFFVLYNYISHKQVTKKVAAVSALSTTILWEMASKLFGYYLRHFASFGKIYGAYVFVIVIALWIYYSAVIFIIGAEIGQLYRERHS